MIRRAVGLLAVGALVLAGSLLAPIGVRANGVPTKVQLGYLEGLSNWGPQTAHGSLELLFAEGVVKLSATGMTRLDHQLYQGWLVKSETNDAIAIGRFNAAADGTVTFSGTLPPLADFGFDLFIITVEPDPDTSPAPSSDRSIGGRFSLVGSPTIDGSRPGLVNSGVTGGPSGTAGNGPNRLPETGDPTLLTDIVRFGALVLVAALSLAIGLRLGRARDGGAA